MNTRRRAKVKSSSEPSVDDVQDKSNHFQVPKLIIFIILVGSLKLFINIPTHNDSQDFSRRATSLQEVPTPPSKVVGVATVIKNEELSKEKGEGDLGGRTNEVFDMSLKHPVEIVANIQPPDSKFNEQSSGELSSNFHEQEHKQLQFVETEKENDLAGLDAELWNKALGAAVVRGKQKEGGNVIARLASYESKRKGPHRKDGKAFKAGEAGCPSVPKLAPLAGGGLKKGDKRLKTIHFVHPPKSGGTTFGQVVISSACELNKNFKDSLDCCADPHDWCGENCQPIPECQAVFGCTLCDCHHIPRLNRMKDATYSVTIIRHPMTRYISGYFYRAHSPNWDRFNLRPGYFSRDPTYPFKFSFDEYLLMPEYHNILIKMFSKDKFPYFNITLTKNDIIKSKNILSKFTIIGINEAYDASVQIMLKILNIQLKNEQIHLPAAMTSTYSNDHENFKNNLRNNKKLEHLIFKANQYDVELYQWSVGNFCQQLCHYKLSDLDKRAVCTC